MRSRGRQEDEREDGAGYDLPKMQKAGEGKESEPAVQAAERAHRAHAEHEAAKEKNGPFVRIALGQGRVCGQTDDGRVPAGERRERTGDLRGCPGRRISWRELGQVLLRRIHERHSGITVFLRQKSEQQEMEKFVPVSGEPSGSASDSGHGAQRTGYHCKQQCETQCGFLCSQLPEKDVD